MPEAGAAPAADSVDQAIAWYVRLGSGQATAQDRSAFESWLAGAGEHALAWQRVQAMVHRVQAAQAHVRPAVARSVLQSVAQAPARRRAIKALAWMGVGGPALYLAQRHLPWNEGLRLALADERTRTGERRALQLPDGTRLLLNTATAVDVRYDGGQRRIVLRAGEILVTTAADPAGRPLRVETQDGALVPVGTRFTVRRDGDGQATHVSVAEGAVDVRPAGASAHAVRVAAGQQASFTRDAAGAVAALDDARQAWTDGVLVAAGTPLRDFVAELGRYRSGRVQCAPEVAGLRITGTWPLDGGDPTERILASLERQLPVRVDRLTRYWVTLRGR